MNKKKVQAATTMEISNVSANDITMKEFSSDEEMGITASDTTDSYELSDENDNSFSRDTVSDDAIVDDSTEPYDRTMKENYLANQKESSKALPPVKENLFKILCMESSSSLKNFCNSHKNDTAEAKKAYLTQEEPMHSNAFHLVAQPTKDSHKKVKLLHEFCPKDYLNQILSEQNKEGKTPLALAEEKHRGERTKKYLKPLNAQAKNEDTTSSWVDKSKKASNKILHHFFSN